MKKQIYLIGGLFVLIIVFFAASQIYVWNKTKVELPRQEARSIEITQKQTQPTLSEKKEEVRGKTVEIDFGDGKKFTSETSAGTAFQALEELAKSKGFDIETKQYKYGLMVTKIGDLANSGSGYWTYYINGKAGSVASDRQIIYPDGKVEWKFVSN